jgi:hypothetical protein
MACAVAILWSCLVGEHVMLRRAAAERIRVLREIEQLQKKARPTPASAPAPAAWHRAWVAAG